MSLCCCCFQSFRREDGKLLGRGVYDLLPQFLDLMQLFRLGFRRLSRKPIRVLFLTAGKLVISPLSVLVFPILLFLHIFDFVGRRFWQRNLNMSDEVQVDFHLLNTLAGGFVRSVDDNLFHEE